MAGAMRKVAVYLGLVEDRDRYDDEYDDSTYEQEADDGRTGQASSVEERTGTVAPFPGRRPIQVVSDQPAPSSPRIVTLHPRTYNDARLVGEHYRDGSPVIMNLTGMDDADAKRLVDFGAGLIFGTRGSIDRITTKVFLLSPANVTVRAEDKERIAENGFFNQS
ncbi:MAG TPA: cell division protein SepF [Actinopolymorphaceae bacterium]